MKGETLEFEGNPWTIVDVSPAVSLAEMAAVILEEEGISVIICTLEENELSESNNEDQFGTAYVLVPECESPRALELIKDSVTDYRGEQIEGFLEGLSNDLDE